MSKAYPSNLTLEQYELLRDLIPEPKPGGRPRTVDVWEVLDGLFYILVEGVRWRALPGDFPPWQTVYTYFRNWRKDGTWGKLHDSLRDWVSIEYLPRHDPYYGEALGVNCDHSSLLKRPLRASGQSLPLCRVPGVSTGDFPQIDGESHRASPRQRRTRHLWFCLPRRVVPFFMMSSEPQFG